MRRLQRIVEEMRRRREEKKKKQKEKPQWGREGWLGQEHGAGQTQARTRMPERDRDDGPER